MSYEKTIDYFYTFIVIRMVYFKFYLVIELFEQISIGSSLNPDIQHDLNDIIVQKQNNQYENNQNYQENEEENDIENNDMLIDANEYKFYSFTNTVDQIFKTEKQKKDLSEWDVRRFEDA